MCTERYRLRFLENAITFAHEAVAAPTPENIRTADQRALGVAARLAEIPHFELTLSEAREIVRLLEELRVLLSSVHRRDADVHAA